MEREALPIKPEELDKWISTAERALSKIDGERDLEDVLKDLSPQETWRVLPEEMALVFLIRQAVCFYYWFVDHLMERTGQREAAKELQARGGVISPEIQERAAFISAYSMFVAASYIQVEAARMLRTREGQFAALDTSILKLDIRGSFDGDLGLCLARYIDAIQAKDQHGNPIIHIVGDELSISRDYWSWVAEQARTKARAHKTLGASLDHITFRYQKFTITGTTVEKAKDNATISFVPVQPEEIVGNDAAVLQLRRQMDRLACYDPQLGKNPFCEMGGVLESILLDGPPGTGKSSIMRMAMTLLQKRADQIGMPTYFKSLGASDVKSEWYGKTSQLLNDLLNDLKDPGRLSIMCLDDVDLLFAGGDRSSPGMGGGDRDILKGLMDFFSGVGSAYSGSYITIAATNAPTATDAALRQRFVARFPVMGPETPEDFADLIALLLRKATKQGIVKIPSTKYEPLTRARKAQAKHATVAFDMADTWLDLGMECQDFRKQSEHFTGRSIKNVIDTVLANASDFDVPEEWYTDPSRFRSLSWDTRVSMVRELYSPIDSYQVLTALRNQHESELRYRMQAK